MIDPARPDFRNTPICRERPSFEYLAGELAPAPGMVARWVARQRQRDSRRWQDSRSWRWALGNGGA